MAVDWYLMDQPPIYNGGFEGEEFFAYAQDGFKEMLDTTMLCDNVEFINSDFSVITPGKAIIQSVTPDTQLKAEDRQILVPIGTLQTYSYIRFEDEIWIIASEPSNNKFYEKAPQRGSVRPAGRASDPGGPAVCRLRKGQLIPAFRYASELGELTNTGRKTKKSLVFLPIVFPPEIGQNRVNMVEYQRLIIKECRSWKH